MKSFLKIILILAVIFTGSNCSSLNRNKVQLQDYKPIFSQKKPRTLPLQSGEWEGRYMDINVIDFILKLKLNVKDTIILGTITLIYIKDNNPASTFSCPLQGTVKGDTVKFSFPNGDSRFHFTGIIEEQNIQSMRGTAETDSSLYFSSGVWIAHYIGQ